MALRDLIDTLHTTLKQSIYPSVPEDDSFLFEIDCSDFETTVHFARAFYYYSIGNSIWHIHLKRAACRAFPWEGRGDAIKQFLNGPTY